ncbi:hypothetical protein DPMN_149279 [Dreissena polymorpha]|uniref:G-protein coupled receptors family 3 profile domain-containing protein n=1 Tax=Dreissena polymorpha TaxID=45954 RepID=A0A9D4FDA0_DREPO|nr:hypothetical protein DPMN_149279 [Dreissena polymorpha]
METEIRTADSGEKIHIIVFYPVCESEQAYYFNWTLRIMNGALLAFGAFLSWETRQVHIEALNDSKTIGICVYNVVILSAVELLLSLLLKNKPIELHGVSSVCLFAGTFVSKMLIFLPKMLAVYRNPNATPPTALNLESLTPSHLATQRIDVATIRSPEHGNTNKTDGKMD